MFVSRGPLTNNYPQTYFVLYIDSAQVDNACRRACGKAHLSVYTAFKPIRALICLPMST